VSETTGLGYEQQRSEQQAVPDEPAAIHSDIEETRERMGETVDEISRRLDMRVRLRSAMRDAGQRAGEVQQQANDVGRQISTYARSHPTTVARGAAVLVVATGFLILVRRRNRGSDE
jgi:ElaB/YqjD/DUF883 family membrane-anchored ribosome-binding protein